MQFELKESDGVTCFAVRRVELATNIIMLC